MTWLRNQTLWAWVGYLGWCFCIYAAYLFASTIWKGKRPWHARRWMGFVKRLSRWRERGRAHQTAIAYTSALVLLAMLVTGAWMRRGNVVVEHNVAVIGHLPDGDWKMSSDEEPDLVFRPCVGDIKAGID